MNDLLALQTALAHGINHDPVLCLAHAVSWLDPLYDDDHDIDVPESEHDTVQVALHILRGGLPDIYIEALQTIRYGATYGQLDSLICGGIQALGIPLDHLEYIFWGIPLPAYGMTWGDPDLPTDHPEVIPLLACFDVSTAPNTDGITIPQTTYEVADHIADDLLRQEHEGWRQVGWLVKWLFGLSNNSCVDWDQSTMDEMPPFSWDTDDLAFACEIIEEADGIMQDASDGMEWISQHPVMLEILTKNIQKVYKKKGRHNVQYQLEWPHITACDERRTELVA